MKLGIIKLFGFAFLCAFETTVHAASFATNINFNEAAFPTAATDVTGAISYNVLDDLTGAELSSLNGDLNDITITTTGDYEYQTTSSGRFTSSHSFTGTVPENNPGTRVINTLELTFASHLSVTDFSFDASSTNTRGLTYEVTVFQLLKPDGSVFSAMPTIATYLNHTEINGGIIGSPGVYVLDQKGTVNNVGTDATSAGTSNPNQNFAVTGDLEYSDFGLAAGTEIGGLLITNILEDTRGMNNGSSTLTSSFIDFTFSGDIVPEPSSAALVAMGSFCLFIRRVRK